MTLKRLRVDNVGSMLRPAALREAFVKYADGGLSEEQLTHEQDEAIRAVIAHQERIGFPIVVDGEFRRTGYLASFADIEGAEDWLSRWTPRRLHREQPVTAGPARGADPVHSDDLRTPAHAKLRLTRNRPLEEYAFAAKQTDTPAKITIIGPDRVSTLHHLGHPDDVYGDAEEFMADVVKVEREMIGQIVDAGCKYVHIDEPGFTAYADEASLEVLRSRGDDPEVNRQRSIDANNELIAGFPDDVVFGVTCAAATARASGIARARTTRSPRASSAACTTTGSCSSTTPIAPAGSSRCGSSATTRSSSSASSPRRPATWSRPTRSSAGSRRRPPSCPSSAWRSARSAASPRASSGNLISEDDQWRKLELVLSVAQDVWGE